MSVKVINGDLLESNAKYIAHQCNVLSQKAGHLAKSVFNKYPYANVYGSRKRLINWRESRDRPGTISIMGDGLNNRYVINMFAQIFPGSPRFPDSISDGHNAREKYFINCLKEISKISNLDSVGFPWQVGCGAAGGNWERYRSFIDEFALNLKADIFIYRLEL